MEKFAGWSGKLPADNVIYCDDDIVGLGDDLENGKGAVFICSHLCNIEILIEIIVKVININVDVNSEILVKCKPLNEYSSFIDIMHKYSVAGDVESFSMAVQKAIDAGILSDYLQRRRKEVENMVTGMYDYDLDMEMQREEAREEGIAIGEERGIVQGIAQGAHKKAVETARGMIADSMPLSSIAKYTGLSIEELQDIEAQS